MSLKKNLSASRAGTSITKASALLGCGQMQPVVAHWNKQQQQQTGPGLTA